MRKLICNEQDRRTFIEQITSIELRDRTFIAEFKVFRRIRTIKQNKLYRLWLSCIKTESEGSIDGKANFDTEDLHIYFKRKFLPWNTVDVFGEDIKKAKSTKFLNTLEFTNYLEQIRMFALHELAIVLPQPGDQGWDDFYQRYGIE